MKLHRLLDVLHPLLQLVAVVARQVQYHVVFIVQLQAVLILLLGEFVPEAVIQTDNLIEEDNLHLSLVSWLFGHGKDVDVLWLDVVEGLLILIFCEYAKVRLQAEESHELFFVEAALGEEVTLNHGQNFHLRFLEIVNVLLGLVQGAAGVLFDVRQYIILIIVQFFLLYWNEALAWWFFEHVDDGGALRCLTASVIIRSLIARLTAIACLL